MNLTSLGVMLLIANAFAHLMQYWRIRGQDDVPQGTKMGIFGFVIINAVIAGLVLFGPTWSYYLAILFPLVGGIGLATTFRTAPGSKTISILILMLDLALVLIFGYLAFLI